ncbi:MAG: inositol monophosphatase family protein [Devosiaceae bacterium]|nr:inositol monophosphatase family protein [Devosiaceae bacterium]
MLEATKAASKITLPLFRSSLVIENKLKQGFDPVTKADRDAEQKIREVIERAYPSHSIFGEELDDKITNNPYAWVIDPIDGTRAFISGLPTWGTLIGLLDDKTAIAGLMSQPFTGEIFIATGKKAEYIYQGKITPLISSTTKNLSEAIMFTTTPALFAKPTQRAAYDEIEGKVRLARYGVDCYAYALLAMGQIDLIIEPDLKQCDIAPLIAIIENSGAVVSTWNKKSAHNGGNIIAAATPELLNEALDILDRYLRD